VSETELMPVFSLDCSQITKCLRLRQGPQGRQHSEMNAKSTGFELYYLRDLSALQLSKRSDKNGRR